MLPDGDVADVFAVTFAQFHFSLATRFASTAAMIAATSSRSVVDVLKDRQPT